MEVELKCLVDDLSRVESLLVAKGVSFSSGMLQVDTYLKVRGKELEPQGVGSALLRLREEPGESFLTVKVLTGRPGVWEEHETSVADSVATKVC